MANIVYAPNKYNKFDDINIFLAGSIEMGVAENWQDKVIKGLENEDVTILNPRRLDWDSSWTQSIENKQFKEQVEWELTALEESDIILMYFDPNTKSPISLLELGLYARSAKMVVCCPEPFWRKGNVDVVCSFYGAYQVTTINDLIVVAKTEIENLNTNRLGSLGCEFYG